MKIYISADIEGVAGIAAWEEARRSSPYYPYFAEQMTKEVAAACEGAIMAGAADITVKDAHGSAMNINPSKLPESVRLIRGWSGHPYKMIHGIDEDCDAIIFVGYHSDGGSDKNPLAHTVSSAVIDYMKLNDEYMSEFLLHSYLALHLEIPVVFLSGDRGICDEAKRFDENIITVATSEGIGAASVSIHPDRAVELIRVGVKCSLEGNLGNIAYDLEEDLGNGMENVSGEDPNSDTENALEKNPNNDIKHAFREGLSSSTKSSIKKSSNKNKVELPGEFILEIGYKYHGDAYKNSFYPGAVQNSPKSILFKTDDYFEIMRATSFVI